MSPTVPDELFAAMRFIVYAREVGRDGLSTREMRRLDEARKIRDKYPVETQHAAYLQSIPGWLR